jgi:hypothetical protein
MGSARRRASRRRPRGRRSSTLREGSEAGRSHPRRRPGPRPRCSGAPNSNSWAALADVWQVLDGYDPPRDGRGGSPGSVVANRPHAVHLTSSNKGKVERLIREMAGCRAGLWAGDQRAGWPRGLRADLRAGLRAGLRAVLRAGLRDLPLRLSPVAPKPRSGSVPLGGLSWMGNQPCTPAVVGCVVSMDPPRAARPSGETLCRRGAYRSRGSQMTDDRQLAS